MIVLSIISTMWLPETSTTVTENSGITTIVDPNFFGHDYHSVIELILTALILPLILSVRELSKNQEQTKTQNKSDDNAFRTLWIYLGGDNSIFKAILNVGFIVVGFISLWALVRTAGIAAFTLLSFDWRIEDTTGQIFYIVEYALFIFLIYSLRELVKGDMDKNMINAIKITILAFIISVLQIIPIFADIGLYNNWFRVSPLILPITIILFVGAIAVLSIIFFRFRNAQTVSSSG